MSLVSLGGVSCVSVAFKGAFDEFGCVFDEFGRGLNTSLEMSLGLILMSLMSLGVCLLCVCCI